MIKTRKYAIIILLYALAQFTSALFIGIANSLAVYISFCFTSLYTLYFYKNRKILDWVLSISIPSIILFIVILIVSSFFANYSADESIIGDLSIFFMFVLPSLAYIFIMSLISKWIGKKQYSDKFIKIITLVYLVPLSIYAVPIVFFIGLIIISPMNNIYSDSILIYSFIFIYFVLPPVLTIEAYANKKINEVIFHLAYMIFAPLLIYLFMIPLKEVSLIILCIPLLFVLKNYYLWYRDYKRKQAIREDKD
ncbi:hypothetical protein [Helicobacter apodemus]|uniref:Uncharacterized protein n=1 Tax=Helicobacter apodemus TaxID=135569 RepID=A0A2U8FBQ4_9HELI|nr:hypothetical protein [Helicobacter apodemus]AWI33327.1 hypothetical protein CDV25_00095 [Helicobacter apodemus]